MVGASQHVVGVHRDYRHAIGVCIRDSIEVRKFGNTGATPGTPKIDDRHLAARIRYVDSLAVEGLKCALVAGVAYLVSVHYLGLGLGFCFGFRHSFGLCLRLCHGFGLCL